MNYLVMGLAFAAVGFVVTNTVLSLLTLALWRALRPALRRAGPLFLLRMLPALGSAAFVLGLVLPAFFAFEPRDTAERAGMSLAALVVLAGTPLVLGLCRTVASWRRTRRLERTWLAAAVGRTELGIPVLAYRVPSDLPLAALVGILRPRLFVSGGFLDALSADERQAVLEHEAAHAHALDNLKRTAMRLAPDWLQLSQAGKEIESAWATAAEDEADDRASGPDRARSLDLAGALLKASRMVPMHGTLASSFSDEATTARRVARLLTDLPDGARPHGSLASRFAWTLALLSAAGMLIVPALPVAYAWTEAALRLLR